jgi:NAD dependent epimerase/dehydratase family enzyme
LRSGLVLARTGALRRLRRAARLGLGGPGRPGSRGQPWIHLDDEIGLLLLALMDERARGPINCVAPETVTSAQFMAGVRAQVGVPGGVPPPPWLVPGAVAATTGRTVTPERALALGYDFRHPELEGALER